MEQEQTNPSSGEAAAEPDPPPDTAIVGDQEHGNKEQEKAAAQQESRGGLAKLLKVNSTIVTATATAVIAAATVTQYCVSQRQWQQTQDIVTQQFEVTARPYIYIEDVELVKPLAVGERVQVRFWIRNTGNTNAEIKDFVGSIISDGPPFGGRLPPPEYTDKPPFDVGPNIRRGFIVTRIEALNDSSLGDLLSSRKVIYVRGRFSVWSPAFNRSYGFVEYCFYYDPIAEGKLGGCPIQSAEAPKQNWDNSHYHTFGTLPRT